VAYTLQKPGAASELSNVAADRLVKVPKGISDQQAAAIMLKGLTAHYLIRRTYRVAKGDYILVHAAAGGVGLVLCQWAKSLGAKVIGVVGSQSKADLARKNGCRYTLILGQDDVVARVKEITRGEGVAVVYDSVGKATFEKGLDCLARRGMMVLFGQSSGAVTPVDPQVLNQKGSVYLTRPTLFHYIALREELLERSSQVLGWVREGAVKLTIFREMPLEQAAEAHRILEARQTAGKVLLIP